MVGPFALVVILVVVFLFNYMLAKKRVGSGQLEVIEGTLSRGADSMVTITRWENRHIQSFRVADKPIRFPTGFETIEAGPGDVVTVVASKEANVYMGLAMRNKTTGFVSKLSSGGLYAKAIVMGVFIFFGSFFVIGLAFWSVPMTNFMLARKGDKAAAMLPK